MVAYLDKMKAISMKIKDFKFCQILRVENKKADALTNLASAFDFISDRRVLLEFLPNPSIDVANIGQLDFVFRHDGFNIDQIDFASSTEHCIREIILGLDHWLERQFTKSTFGLIWNKMQWRSLESATSVKGLLRSVIPIRIGIPSFRMMNFNKENNKAKLRLNLDLLTERKECAEVRLVAYKHQVTKYYNKRVKHRSFLPGDMVLRKVILSTKELNAGKLDLTWEGSYRVVKVSRLGTYWKEDIRGGHYLAPGMLNT
ncbi:hypothetical protein Acr_00g0014380 [Actinidia rufa]|uniref:Uncharacterized protein n=1 Tax=Actinidia rufa TaxID=165716 RepID=A0A7J0DAF0_9ERIC|nr:hypothetical protein Acr_00g0014380 [Actinidia rufa]